VKGEGTMSSMESAIVEAVTTDRAQVLLSAGTALDAFDECLERVLHQQLRLDAEGVVRSWLHTQLKIPVRMPKSRSPIEALYRQIVRKAGPRNACRLLPRICTSNTSAAQARTQWSGLWCC